MLLCDATLASFAPPRVERADLRIAGGSVVERGAALVPLAGEDVVSLGGALVLPGLVNAHTHLYSALARGMPGPAVAPRGFVEILERVWWRLDRALDEESIALSALVGASEAALSGTTLLLDHHASPNCIAGSLTALRRAVERVGLRSALCYETTDRNGLAGRDAGLEENRAFLFSGPTPLNRGLVGAHACFTLSEDSLARLGDLVRATGAGFHIHAAEAEGDAGVTERLDRHGLLGPRTLLAHGVHLRPEEIDLVHERGAVILHNPRSNMNNGVGAAPEAALARAALGTDGVDEDMLAEMRVAYLKMRERGIANAGSSAIAMLAEGQRLASALFGLPFGTLEGGAAADLVVLDYRPPTPVDTESLVGHLLFGVDRGHVRSVMVAGRFVVRDRRLVNVEAEAVFAEARGVARRLWERMARL